MGASGIRGERVPLPGDLANIGFRLFHRRSFYPDFILWLHNARAAQE